MVSHTPQLQSPAAAAAPVAVSQAGVVDVLAVAIPETNYVLNTPGKASIWRICRQITDSEGTLVCQVSMLCHPKLTPQEGWTKFKSSKKIKGIWASNTGSSTVTVTTTR